MRTGQAQALAQGKRAPDRKCVWCMHPLRPETDTPVHTRSTGEREPPTIYPLQAYASRSHLSAS